MVIEPVRKGVGEPQDVSQLRRDVGWGPTQTDTPMARHRLMTYTDGETQTDDTPMARHRLMIHRWRDTD